MPDAPAPSAHALRRARVFWEQAELDHQAARQKHKAGRPVEASHLSFQAALNALTAVATLHGAHQRPAHSTAQMASLCAESDPRFEALRPACEALEDVQQASPFDAAPDGAALTALSGRSLAHAEQVLAAVRAYLKEHRKRFFAP